MWFKDEVFEEEDDGDDYFSYKPICAERVGNNIKIGLYVDETDEYEHWQLSRREIDFIVRVMNGELK